MLRSIILICLLQTGLILSSKVELEATMPNVSPHSPDLYLCHKVKLDQDKPIYITEFAAKSTKEIAHHILLFACSDAGPDDTWNCGEMSHHSGDTQFKVGPVCRSRQNIIFAWALDAPKLVLPEDVAFKLGGDTMNKYLVVQVHYANVDLFADGSTDNSGIILKGQTEPVSKLAGVYLMGTGGSIPSQTQETFEAACQIKENVEMHPFAYRTHAHKLGVVNSGYLVTNGPGKQDQQWTEIGRRSPQLPQMFFPVTNDVTVRRGDVLAARCTMFNFVDHDVKIGATGDDEMCNFYIMYWVQGDNLLSENTCFSNGPPYWHFRNFKTREGIPLYADSIPKDASKVPDAQLEELDRIKQAGGLHGAHGANHNNHKQEEKDDEMEMDHSHMDHSQMSHESKSKYLNKIIQKLLAEYGSENRRIRFHKKSMDSSSEEDLDELEKAYLLKKLLNRIGIN